ncbi:MAG: hypothetical protein ACI4F7_00165 [Acutalibacteraceae bacterium]
MVAHLLFWGDKMRNFCKNILKFLLLYVVFTTVVALIGLLFQKTYIEILIEGFVNTICFVIVITIINKVHKKKKIDDE